jgi:hypothetical protein
LHGDKTYNSFVCGNSITAKLTIISTDEDRGLRIESFVVFVVINLRGVSTNKTIIIL